MVAAISGCGLISSDVTNFDLTLPDKNFTVDTSSWQIDQNQAKTFLMTSCANQPMLCSSAATQACMMGCSGTCNTTTKQCDLTLDVSLHQAINLVMEKPELQSINDEPVIKVTIDTVTYEVKTNSLNVATPPMTIFVAPISVTKPNDAAAKAIATVDPVPAGMVTDGPQPVTFTDTGKMELINIMSTYKIPFNVLVGSTLTVNAQTPVPTGKLDAIIHIKAHAGL
jgi:hypothetical protein